MMKIKFKEWDCILVPGQYSNGRKAISLQDINNHEPITTGSVNIVDIPCPDDCMFIKDYSENEGMANALITAGFIDPVVLNTVKSGWVDISLYQITEEGLKLFE